MRFIIVLATVCCLATPARCIELLELPPNLQKELLSALKVDDFFDKMINSANFYMKEHDECDPSDKSCATAKRDLIAKFEEFLPRFEHREDLLAAAKTEADARDVLVKWKMLHKEAGQLWELSERFRKNDKTHTY